MLLHISRQEIFEKEIKVAIYLFIQNYTVSHTKLNPDFRSTVVRQTTFVQETRLKYTNSIKFTGCLTPNRTRIFVQNSNKNEDILEKNSKD